MRLGVVLPAALVVAVAGNVYAFLHAGRPAGYMNLAAAIVAASVAVYAARAWWCSR